MCSFLLGNVFHDIVCVMGCLGFVLPSGLSRDGWPQVLPVLSRDGWPQRCFTCALLGRKASGVIPVLSGGGWPQVCYLCFLGVDGLRCVTCAL